MVLDYDKKEWDEQTLAYAAGFLDGEGCFYCNQNNNHKIQVAMENTNRPIIEWFQEQFGGRFFTYGIPSNPKHRQLYRWDIADKQAFHFCKLIVPFLKQKTEEALILILIQQTKGLPKIDRKNDPQILQERIRLNTELKKLKHATW